MKTVTTLFLLLLCVCAISQTETVTTKGQIKDNTGVSVPFAAIFVKKTNTGVYADSLGNFTINTKMNDTLAISAIGFNNASFVVNGKTGITVNLKRETNNLADVKVTANNRQQNATNGQPTIMEQQSISNSIDNYRATNNLSSSTGMNSYSVTTNAAGTRLTSLDETMVMGTGVPPGANFYHGSLMPVFTHTDATQGSPYLFDKWAKGYVVNSSGATIANDSYLFNFDKISQNLLMTQDKKNMIEVDKAIIKSFNLNTDGREYVFEKRLQNNDPKLLQVLAKGAKYTLYKTIITKLEKANYTSTGLTETGHNYDLYIDKPAYYIYAPATNTLKQIDLKKKSIKDALPQDQAKVDAYFSQHADMPINEDFAIGLISDLN